MATQASLHTPVLNKCIEVSYVPWVSYPSLYFSFFFMQISLKNIHRQNRFLMSVLSVVTQESTLISIPHLVSCSDAVTLTFLIFVQGSKHFHLVRNPTHYVVVPTCITSCILCTLCCIDSTITVPMKLFPGKPDHHVR